MKTHLIAILDMSGSMYSLTSDTIGGFNSLIAEQKKSKADVDVTLILFNDKYEKVYDKKDIKEVEKLTDDVYVANGTTALLDAIGKTITEFKTREKKPKVMLTITTDGMENASREFNKKTIKTMLEDKQKLGWEVLFIGANIDAVGEAQSLGIRADRARQYVADEKGTKALWKSVAKANMAYSVAGEVSEDWANAIDMDNESRKK